MQKKNWQSMRTVFVVDIYKELSKNVFIVFAK